MAEQILSDDRNTSSDPIGRPAYPRPTTVAPEIADLMVAAAARKAVWVNPEGTPFWLNSYEQAKAIAAKQGGVAFGPKSHYFNGTRIGSPACAARGISA